MDVPTIPARRIVIKNKSTAWFGTRYTMNIYRGCSHGCIYCDSRSECYGVQDFDTVRVKSYAGRHTERPSLQDAERRGGHRLHERPLQSV